VNRPLPGDVVPDDADQPFWDSCRIGILVVQRCGQCGRHLWPAGNCPDHGAAALSWVPATGKGTLHTWTVIHQRYPNSFADGAAGVVAVVRLEEGPFLHSRLVGCEPGAMRVGLPVEVEFTPVADGVTLPYFRPAAGWTGTAGG
jgi:uncharacterized OB-fold protein